MKNQHFLLFLLYFGLSFLLTWFFVILCPLYISKNQMLLSTAIAGGKWGIQILLALLSLKENAFLFLRKIGFVCFVGSCILIPYIISATVGFSNAGEFFFGSLIACVLTMIFVYYRAVSQLKIHLKWWFIWLFCLVIAISLQLTVVFHYIKL